MSGRSSVFLSGCSWCLVQRETSREAGLAGPGKYPFCHDLRRARVILNSILLQSKVVKNNRQVAF